MSDTTLLPSLSPSEARQIDQTCDRFEAAWKARRPSPEEYLAAAGEPARSALLRQLLLVDWDYRRRAGHDPQAADYRARFPDDSALIEDVRREMSDDAVSTQVPARDANAQHTPWSGDRGLESPGEADAAAETGPDRYALLREVGHGGIGVVYRGRDRHLGRELAIKVLHEDYRDRPDARRRFVAEARVGSQLQHPSIVPIYEQGWFKDRRPYLTMKLVEGHTLAALLRDRADPGQDVPRLLGVFAPVCQAMAYAHARGVVHRDLKPANIMVGAFGEVQVMDWGFAKVFGGAGTAAKANPPDEEPAERGQSRPVRGPSTVSQSGVMMGTPAYMPPEQARGEAALIDARADVFALGAILCEILTGRPPYVGGSADDVCRTAVAGDLADAYARLDASGADVELRELARRCLAAERANRPPDAGIVSRELTAYLTSAQEQLRQAQLERAAALARAQEAAAKAKAERHARRLTLALAAVLLLGAGIAGWQAAVATQAKRDALAAAAAEKVASDAALAAVEQERQAKEGEARQRKLAETHRLLAESNEKKAVAQQQIAEAVRAFLQRDLLRQADATEQADTLRRLGGGFEASNNPTIKELLDRAATQLTPVKIAARFPNQPEVQAAILRTLGDTYLDIGEYSKAVAFLVRSSDTAREAGGATDAITLNILNDLALAYTAAGKPAKAIELFEHLRDIKRTRADHADMLLTLHNLAAAYRAAGKTDKAIELFEQVRDARIKELGAGDPSTLRTMNSLALAYHDAGRLPEAIALFEIVRDARVKDLGPEYPATLTTMNNLAVTYLKARKLPEAIELFVQVRDAQVKIHGADHPLTIGTLNNLASAYSEAGDLPQAIALLEQVRIAMLKKVGPDHRATLNVLNNLAGAYHRAKQLPQAIELYEQARDGLVKQLGADHPWSLTTINNLAGAYQAAGNQERALPLYLQAAKGVEKRNFLHLDARTIVGNLAACQEALHQYAEAEAWRRKWLAHAKAQGTPKTQAYANDLALLGWNLLKQKKWQDAEPELRACLVLRESVARGEKAAAPSWQIAHVKSMLGEALTGQNDHAGAEPLLLAGYQGMQEDTLPPQARARVIEAIERLVALYAATGKKEHEAKWQKQLEAAKQ